MRLWRKPKTIHEWFLATLGFVGFWLMLPLWILLSIAWFRENSVFVVLHIQALCYNPWEMWK